MPPNKNHQNIQTNPTNRTKQTDTLNLNNKNPISIMEFLKLFRLQTGATTALAPVIGYLIMAAQTNYEVQIITLVVLFIIGILMHIFEFVLNEYIDLDVDRRSPDLKEKPLVKGSVSPLAALVVVIVAMTLSYLMAILFFFDLWTMIFLTLAFEFGAIYDIFGKRFAGSDFMLALWIFFFCLFGASTISHNFTAILILVAGLGFFQILFNNAIEGGLKDSDHDASAGAKTLANSLGVQVINGKPVIPTQFKVVSYAIKFGYSVIILCLILFSVIDLSGLLDIIQIFLIIILFSIIFFTMHKFLSIHEFRRDKLKRIFSVHEIATFYLSTIIVLQIIGIVAVFSILILPLAWYMALNTVLYGRPLEPKV